MTSMGITMKLTILLAIIGLVSSQQFSILGNIFNRSFGNIAFALSTSCPALLDYHLGFPSTKTQGQPKIRLTDWDDILKRNSKVSRREELQGGSRTNLIVALTYIGCVVSLLTYASITIRKC